MSLILCAALPICLCHRDRLLHLLQRSGTCWVALDSAGRGKISLRPLYKQISSVLSNDAALTNCLVSDCIPKCISYSTPSEEEQSCLSGNQTKWLYMHCHYQCFKPIQIQGFSCCFFLSQAVNTYELFFGFHWIFLFVLFLLSQPWKLMLLTQLDTKFRMHPEHTFMQSLLYMLINTTCALQLCMAEIRRGFQINLSGRKTWLRVLSHRHAHSGPLTTRARLGSTCKNTNFQSENHWL